VHNGRTLVQRKGDGAGLVLFSPREAPPGERYLLGVDGEGVTYFAVVAPLPGIGRPVRPGDDGQRMVSPLRLSDVAEGEIVSAGLRQVGGLLADRDAGLLVYAVALEEWHATHGFCPRCGSRTEVRAGGHLRVCPADASQHF